MLNCRSKNYTLDVISVTVGQVAQISSGVNLKPLRTGIVTCRSKPIDAGDFICK